MDMRRQHVDDDIHPRCPRCSTKLAETLTVKELEVEVGDEQRKVRIAYCGLCGSALGLFP
jgi:uncharacterized protein with PIN domain